TLAVWGSGVRIPYAPPLKQRRIAVLLFGRTVVLFSATLTATLVPISKQKPGRGLIPLPVSFYISKNM
ncbi:MAG: hypothetical protein IJN11_05620, partial [Oscillospiraceae bacterium]|nr:hypothetical protein [Oscillospiraceae bacterium]